MGRIDDDVQRVVCIIEHTLIHNERPMDLHNYHRRLYVGELDDTIAVHSFSSKNMEGFFGWWLRKCGENPRRYLNVLTKKSTVLNLSGGGIHILCVGNQNF